LNRVLRALRGAESDPALVSAFVREQRATLANTYFVFALLGVGMAVVFAGALAFVLGPRALAIAHLACLEVALVASLYTAFTRSRWFAEARSAELVLFIALLPGILGIVFALSLDEDRVGWPAHTVLFDNVVILVSFSTFAFVANFRALAMWFAVLIPVYIVWLFAIGTPAAPATFNLISALTLAALAAFSNWSLSRQGLAIFQLQRSLRHEQEKTERLLHSVLPPDIAERLKSGEAVADPYPAATVVFVDIVGSSALARRISPVAFIEALNAIFSIADRHARLQRVEKVKTIGDAYLVVAGARGGGDAVGALQFGLGVIRDVAALSHERQLGVGVRVGIHTGPVIGGVIGSERAIYDYWGDTMNTAARLESVAPVNGVAVSQPVFEATRRIVAFEPPRVVPLKGIGDFQVYDFVPDPG
jgi:class 3 adenylate cyclase